MLSFIHGGARCDLHGVAEMAFVLEDWPLIWFFMLFDFLFWGLSYAGQGSIAARRRYSGRRLITARPCIA